MTLTIDVDKVTEARLALAASRSGKSLEEYAADILRTSPDPLELGRKPNLGFAANWGIKIADDFDDVLDDFKEYM